MAVLAHAGDCITALMTLTVQFSPWHTLRPPLGWSFKRPGGNKPTKGRKRIVRGIGDKLRGGHIICPRRPITVLTEGIKGVVVIPVLTHLWSVILPTHTRCTHFISQRGNNEARILPRAVEEGNRD